jgi:50S ribosomal subunit-associated GTPase HflX
MDTSLTSIQQQLRRLEQLVSSESMSADDLRLVELGLKNIIDRIDTIQAIARDLHQPAQISAEDTKGLESLEDALKESLKQEVGD